MPLSMRELFLVIRARDEASRTLRGVSREMMATGAAAVAAASRASAAMARQEAQRHRAAAAAARETASLALMTGATHGQINALRRAAIAHDQQARALESSARAHDRAARAVFDNAQRHAHFTNVLQQTGTALSSLGVGMLATGGILAYGLYDAIKVTMEYDRQVRQTATQIDGFKGNLKELGDIGRRVARDIAIPFEQIQPALFDIFSSTEANMAEAEVLLRAFSKAAVAGQVDVQAASRATIGIMNAFQIPLKDVNKVLDMQFQLIQEGVGTYEEWSTKLGNVSPSAARAGQSIEMMMAALAASTRMGMNAARSSTAVARAFDALSNPKVADKLGKMGIAVHDAQGKFRPFNEVLREFRTELMKMPEKDRVAAILDVFKGAGSTIEARKFLQSMLLMPGTLETFDDLLKEVTNSTGSLDKAYGTMADGAQAKTVLLRNAWMLLREGLGQALLPAFTQLVEWLTKIVNKFNDLPEATKKTIALVVAAVAGILVVGGTFIAVAGMIAIFVAAISAAGSVILATMGFVAGFVLGLAALGAAFYGLWQNSESFRGLVLAIKEDLLTLQAAFVVMGAGLKQAFDIYIAPALRTLWSYINENVLPAFRTWRDEVSSAFIPKIIEAGRVMKDILGAAMIYIGIVINTMLIPAIRFVTEWWIRNRATIEPLLPILAQLMKWILIVAGVLVGVLAAALIGPVIGAFIAVIAIIFGVVAAITAWIRKIQEAWGNIQQFIGMVRRMADEVQSQGGRVTAFFGSLPGIIRSAVGDLGSLLVDAGRSVINGLISGIQSQIGRLRSAAAEMAGAIANALPGSPVKEGPLRVLNNGYAGGQIVKMVADGMRAKAGLMSRAFGSLDMANANTVGQSVNGRVGSSTPLAAPSNPLTSKTFNITQNITTQEIDPRVHSAELGWELQGVM